MFLWYRGDVLSVGSGFVEDIRWMMDVLVFGLFRDSSCGGEGEQRRRNTLNIGLICHLAA